MPFRKHRVLARLAAVVAAASMALVGATVAAAAEEPPPAPTAAQSWSNANESFVTRSGTQLMLDGSPFRFNGTNAYWLGLDENVGGVDYPTFFRIKNALDTAKDLGTTVVRSHMMTSTGQNYANPLAIMPALGEYNEEAFATIDYAIAYAGQLGIRLILPLTDEWQYYHGGHRDFTTPHGLSSADFYSHPDAIAAFQEYVEYVVTRTNQWTGVAYVDDPTILAWELGNELEGMTVPWIEDQVDFIKALAPEQLVAAGRRFDINPATLQATNLDIVDVHYYPPTVARITADAQTVANAGKVYVAGEYGSPAAAEVLVEQIANNPNVTGMMFWSLFGHNDRGGFVPHDDGFTQHYPGSTDRERGQNEAVKAYSRALGFDTDTVPLEQPLIVDVSNTYGINSIGWRGSAGAVTYDVERSVDGVTWQPIVTGVPAQASPVLDHLGGGNLQYRVIAHKVTGATAASDVVSVPQSSNIFVDLLEDLQYADAQNITIVGTPRGGHAEATTGEATLTWELEGLDAAQFLVNAGDAAQLTVLSSADGVSWAPAPTSTDASGDATVVSATGLTAPFVRVSFPASADIELARATLQGSPQTPALFDPINDFSLVHNRTGVLSIDSGNAHQFGGDEGRAKRDSTDAASMTWYFDDITDASFRAYYWPDQPVVPLTVSVSTDGVTFTEVTPAITGGSGNWLHYDYAVTGLEDVNYFRISWDNMVGEPWTPQVSEVSLFSPNGASDGVPGTFSTLTPEDGALDLRGIPRLTWTAASQTTFYYVVLAHDAALTDVFEESGQLLSTSYTPQTDLAPGQTYYWSVRAVNGLGETLSDPEVASFTLAPLPTEPLIIDDFEGYVDTAELNSTYVPNSGGGPITGELIASPGATGQGAQFSYNLDGAGYAGVIRDLPETQSWWGYEGIAFEAQATPGQPLKVQFVAGGSYWEATLPPVVSSDWQTYTVSFADFAPPSWAGEGVLDLTRVTQHAFYLEGGGEGSLTIDNVRAVPVDTTTISTSLGVARQVLTGDSLVGFGAGLTDGAGHRVGGKDVTFSLIVFDGSGNPVVNGAGEYEPASNAVFDGGESTVVTVTSNAGGIAIAPRVQTTAAGQFGYLASYGSQSVVLAPVTVLDPVVNEATLEVEPQLVSGKYTLVVTFTNGDDTAQRVQLKSRYGSKTFTNVQPGQELVWNVKTFVSKLPTGEVSATVTAADGVTVVTASYPAAG